jgi:purine nucleosidase
LLGSDVPVYRGSETYLPGADIPVDSEAARDLVERAMASPDDDPLYVVAIGAITNVASALLLEPRIVEKIVVVWLGGQALHWPDTQEFNLMQDLHASRLVFDSGAPLILIPCMGVASGLVTTLSEIRDYVKESGPVGQYLYETYERIIPDHYGRSRVIWDIATIAYLLDEAWVSHYVTHSPKISEQFDWIFDPHRHLMRYVYHLDRDSIFQDLFRKLK